MNCHVALLISCGVAMAMSAPAPQPGPQTIYWPYPQWPLQPAPLPAVPVMSPRSYPQVFFPTLALITNQDTSRGIPQPVDDTAEVKHAKMMHALMFENVKAAHERSKRNTHQSEAEEKKSMDRPKITTDEPTLSESNPVVPLENAETDKAPIQKRQAAYVSQVPIPWPMSLLSVPFYSYATQSYTAPFGSSSYSFVTL